MNVREIILLLQDKGLTQSRIAAAIGCHPSNISSVAHGRHGTVRPSSRVVDGLRKLLAEHGLSSSDS